MTPTDLTEISNAAYAASMQIEIVSRQPEKPIDAPAFADQVAAEVTAAMKDLSDRGRLAKTFSESDLLNIGKATHDVVFQRFRDGRFSGNCHHVRQDIARKVIAVAL